MIFSAMNSMAASSRCTTTSFPQVRACLRSQARRGRTARRSGGDEVLALATVVLAALEMDTVASAAWAVLGVLVFGRERFVGRWEVRSEVVGMESVPEPEADMLAVGEEGDVEVVRMVRLEWVVVPFTGS